MHVSLTPIIVDIEARAVALAPKIAPIRNEVTATQQQLRDMYAKGAGPRVIPGDDPRVVAISHNLREMADALSGALATSGLPATWSETRPYVAAADGLRELSGRIGGSSPVNLHGLASQVGRAFDPVMRLHASTIYDTARTTLSLLSADNGKPRAASIDDLRQIASSLDAFTAGFEVVASPGRAAVAAAMAGRGPGGTFALDGLVDSVRPALKDAARGVAELRTAYVGDIRHGSEAWKDAGELIGRMNGVVRRIDAHSTAGKDVVIDPSLTRDLGALDVYLNSRHYNSAGGAASRERYAVNLTGEWALSMGQGL